MSNSVITALSREQQALIASYREKWTAIATQTQPIDRDKVVEIIRAAYVASNYPEPDILFFSSPFVTIKELLSINNFKSHLGRDIHTKFFKRVLEHLLHLMQRQLETLLFCRLSDQIAHPDFPNHLDRNNNPKTFQFPMGIERCVELQLAKDFDETETDYSDLSKLLQAMTRPAGWLTWGCMLDFCISALNIQHDRQKWKVVRESIEHCDFIFQFENVCAVCERPNRLLFDSKNHLHAEGKPALEFADGYQVYAYHGGNRSE
ncbi:hypothetical protein POG22_15435 [Geitlerinema sp. CS-897]|nr:hypothetical protein [Geitlerinema sp. CS-897]